MRPTGEQRILHLHFASFRQRRRVNLLTEIRIHPSTHSLSSDAMIMLRGSPDSYDSSQRTLLTPYGPAAGSPEEEEELALLRHLEEMQRGQPPPQQPGGYHDQDPQQRGNNETWGEHSREEEEREDEAPWTSAHADPSGRQPQPRGTSPLEDDPPEQAGTHQWRQNWPLPPGNENAWEDELAGDASALRPGHEPTSGAWGQHAGMDEGQADAPHAWSPEAAASSGQARQHPHTMSPPATPELPPAARGQRMPSERPPESTASGAQARPAPGPTTGRGDRDERGGRSGRARQGLDILGQPAPAQQQAPAKTEDARLKKYFKLEPGDNAVVLYNSKAPPGTFQGAPTSSGTTFEQQGMEILSDYSGNAKNNERMIDISEPGWSRKLDELVKTKGKKFDHVFVLDHGAPGSVSFGKHPGAYPELIGMGKDSAPVRVIASVLADNGALHLGSCFTGKSEAGLQYLKDLHQTMDRGNNISIDAITGSMQNRLNQYDGRLIKFPPP